MKKNWFWKKKCKKGQKFTLQIR